MRQRKAKDLDKRLQECSMYMIEKPSGGSKNYFAGDRPLFLEIGCGKGQFILKKAMEPASYTHLTLPTIRLV